MRALQARTADPNATYTTTANARYLAKKLLDVWNKLGEYKINKTLNNVGDPGGPVAPTPLPAASLRCNNTICSASCIVVFGILDARLRELLKHRHRRQVRHTIRGLLPATSRRWEAAVHSQKNPALHLTYHIARCLGYLHSTSTVSLTTVIRQDGDEQAVFRNALDQVHTTALRLIMVGQRRDGKHPTKPIEPVNRRFSCIINPAVQSKCPIRFASPAARETKKNIITPLILCQPPCDSQRRWTSVGDRQRILCELVLKPFRPQADDQVSHCWRGHTQSS